MIKNEKKVLLKLRDERNEHAFDLIYNEYHKLVYYVIYKIVGDHEVARDLSIDTFLTMYNKIDQHDMNKSFKYWLLTIAKNNGKLYLRNNKDKGVIVDNDLVEEVVDSHENYKTMITECCSILIEQEFDILNQHLIFNLTFEEIAEVTELSKSNVHRIYKKAIEKVKIEM